MVRRSILFSPGDKPELLRKAPASGADVLTFDLEDAVPPGQKETGRTSVREVLSDSDPSCELCARINPLGNGGRLDLDAILDVPEAIDSIMLPKVSSPDDVRTLREELANRGVEWSILPLIETAAGVLSAPAIAAESNVDGVVFGAEDLAAEIGATRTETGEEISYARQRLVLAASAVGIDAIDTPVADFEDTALLETDTARSVRLGFDGKLAIHPGQVSIINAAYTPDEDEIEWAVRVLDAREESDDGVFVVDGEMIDRPLITQAERIVARAEQTD
jgi:citrate lyase subunit beta/citryl-CoA lyase